MNKIHWPVVAAAIGLAAPLQAQSQDQADAALAEQNWSAAATAYEVLLQTDSENGANWFSLGQARFGMENFAGAIEAYRRAIDTGFQPVPRARYSLARALAAGGDTASALEELETLAQSGINLGSVVSGTAEFASFSDTPRFAAVVRALTPCTTPEYRHFDFWLGEWDVESASGNSATNSITSDQGGCVILERYTTGRFTGMSINFYDRATGKWHQSWMSNGGGAVYLEGGLNENGEMVMTDAELPVSETTGSINRVTWTPNPDGSVRQHWQVSQDGGENWATSFDGMYRRKAEEAASAE